MKLCGQQNCSRAKMSPHGLASCVKCLSLLPRTHASHADPRSSSRTFRCRERVRPEPLNGSVLRSLPCTAGMFKLPSLYSHYNPRIASMQISIWNNFWISWKPPHRCRFLKNAQRMVEPPPRNSSQAPERQRHNHWRGLTDCPATGNLSVIDEREREQHRCPRSLLMRSPLKIPHSIRD